MLVVMATDAPSRVQYVRVQVAPGSSVDGGGTYTWAGPDLTFPGSFSVTPGAGPEDALVTLQVSIDLAASADGQPGATVNRVARFHLTPHVSSEIRLFMSTSCANPVTSPTTCSDGANPCTVSHFCEQWTPAETCGDMGQCVSLDVMPVALLPDGGMAASDGSDGDASCVPMCLGRACGSDGCGGSCGACPTGQLCSASSQCVVCVTGASCVPSNPCSTGTQTRCGASATCSPCGSASAGSAPVPAAQRRAGMCQSCMAGTSCSDDQPLLGRRCSVHERQSAVRHVRLLASGDLVSRRRLRWHGLLRRVHGGRGVFRGRRVCVRNVRVQHGRGGVFDRVASAGGRDVSGRGV